MHTISLHTSSRSTEIRAEPIPHHPSKIVRLTDQGLDLDLYIREPGVAAALACAAYSVREMITGPPQSAGELAVRLAYVLDGHGSGRRSSATVSEDGEAILVDVGTSDADHHAYVIKVIDPDVERRDNIAAKHDRAAEYAEANRHRLLTSSDADELAAAYVAGWEARAR